MDDIVGLKAAHVDRISTDCTIFTISNEPVEAYMICSLPPEQTTFWKNAFKHTKKGH